MLAFIPLWILPSSFSALSAGAFCVQFGVQGAWGVVRIPVFNFLVTHSDGQVLSIDPYPARRDVSSRLQSYLPWRCLPVG